MDNENFYAFYGTFDQNMFPLEVINVTDMVNEFFLKDGTITIPARIDFNDYFIDPGVDGKKYLQLVTRYRKYNILQDQYDFDIKIAINNPETILKMVYYVFINRNSNWQDIVRGQLLQLKSYGILDEVDLYIHITDETAVFEDVINLVNGIAENAIINTSSVNHFEYPGIKLAYDLANQFPQATIMYLHTKGISYNIQTRKLREIALLRATFERWRKHIEAFNDSTIKKVGLLAGEANEEKKLELETKRGWMWFNFWYARASYLIENCLDPPINTNRYYYEVWLAGPPTDEPLLNDCYSIDKGNSTFYGSSFDADICLGTLAETVE